MINLTEEYVQASAYNAGSFTNAKKLVAKSQLINMHITKDKTLIYGECMGSGKNNYKVSVDFVDEANPVYRCSCPSRQIPCKHSTALLYQYFTDSNLFEEGDIPEDVASKREKIEKRVEKKKEEADKPKKINMSAFVKKMKTQLEAIDLVNKFIKDVLTVGLGSINMDSIKVYEKDLVKSLNSKYLTEHSIIVGDILDDLKCAKEYEALESDRYYGNALEKIAYLKALNKKAAEVLNKHIEEKKFIDEESASIFTKIGYVWKLEELKKLGLYKENGELVQLGFYCISDDIRKTYIDTGIYINLKDKGIYKTLNYRPYRISNKIKTEDSVFEVIQTKEFCIYPGELNPRIRWDGEITRKLTDDDIKMIRSSAKTDYKSVLKEVKNQLKNTLDDKNPICLLHYKDIIKAGDDTAIRDDNGEMILLGDTKKTHFPSTITYLDFILENDDLTDGVMLGIFENDLNSGKLVMQPISIINNKEIVRILG